MRGIALRSFHRRIATAQTSRMQLIYRPML